MCLQHAKNVIWAWFVETSDRRYLNRCEYCFVCTRTTVDCALVRLITIILLTSVLLVFVLISFFGRCFKQPVCCDTKKKLNSKNLQAFFWRHTVHNYLDEWAFIHPNNWSRLRIRKTSCVCHQNNCTLYITYFQPYDWSGFFRF